jgi:hypothetical protein
MHQTDFAPALFSDERLAGASDLESVQMEFTANFFQAALGTMQDNGRHLPI